MIEANTMNMLIADMDVLLDYFYKSNYKTIVNPDVALKKKPTQTDAKAAIEYYGGILDMIQNPDPDELRKLSKPQQTKYYFSSMLVILSSWQKVFFRVIKYFDLWFPKNVFGKLNVNI